ncbi:transcription regulator [Artemisia annua]|uniref:Transcription regulator n=1 Tax=Artemisia annua TaxID=35608 RepID=A0A2U1NAS2_ARTAN|nr:transcription regulator [Artemisia annua]
MTVEQRRKLVVVSDPFPLAAVFGNVWRNIEGQLSFLKYVVSAPPEVFTFAHYKRQLV